MGKRDIFFLAACVLGASGSTSCSSSQASCSSSEAESGSSMLSKRNFIRRSEILSVSEAPAEGSGRGALAQNGEYAAQMVTKDGSVVTMGSNYHGERGNDGGNTYNIPNEASTHVMETLDDVVDVTSASYSVAVLKSDGTVWTWGTNHCGRLGTGEDEGTKRKQPKQLTELPKITKIASGNHYYAAIDENKEVWWWGDLLALNNKCAKRPVKIPGLSNVEQIDIAKNVAVAVKEDGTVWSAGPDPAPSLGRDFIKAHDGLGAKLESGPFLEIVGAPKTAFVAAGIKMVILVTTTGEVYEFGSRSLVDQQQKWKPTKINGLTDIQWATVDNDGGEKGTTSAIFRDSAGRCIIMGVHECEKVYTTPTELPMLKGFVDAAVRTHGATANEYYLMPNGDMYASGKNFFGQLGDGKAEAKSCTIKVRNTCSSTGACQVHTPAPTPAPTVHTPAPTPAPTVCKAVMYTGITVGSGTAYTVTGVGLFLPWTSGFPNNRINSVEVFGNCKVTVCKHGLRRRKEGRKCKVLSKGANNEGMGIGIKSMTLIEIEDGAVQDAGYPKCQDILILQDDEIKKFAQAGRYCITQCGTGCGKQANKWKRMHNELFLDMTDKIANDGESCRRGKKSVCQARWEE